VLVDGERLRPGSVGAAVRSGLGMAPEERKSQALLWRSRSIATSRWRASRITPPAGFTRAGAERAAATRVANSLELQPRDVRRAVRTLSGGNQQKVVVSRWLLGQDDDGAGLETKLLLLDEPTRGVDVGARAELYQVIRRLAESGVGVLLVSSEVPEVLGLADRVLVMREGHVIHEASCRGTG
jgi:ribose transport system ATP-binding protein